MNYIYSIAGLKIGIIDKSNMIDTLDLLYDKNIVNEPYDFACHINHIDKINENDFFLINKFLKKGSKLFVGLRDEKFYTIATHKPIYIVTDFKLKKIEVYTKYGIVNNMSIYMFHIMLKKHIFRLIYQRGLIPIHGALLYDSINNKGILVIGSGGAGKSSIAYYLKTNGLQCIADDVCALNLNTDQLVGSTNGIFVTEDFINRYNIDSSKVICVSPGRKYKILNQSSTNYVSLSNICLILALGNNNINSYDNIEKKKFILNAHENWCLNNNEILQFNCAVNKIVNESKKHFYINFSNTFMENLNNILKSI